jgi:hypothetical protein
MKSLTLKNSGEIRLVDQCPKIKIDQVIGRIKKKFQESILDNQVEIGGLPFKLSSTNLHHGGKRIWFLCSICNRRTGIIYNLPAQNLAGCRKCLGIEYRSRRYRGMIENAL